MQSIQFISLKEYAHHQIEQNFFHLHLLLDFQSFNSILKKSKILIYTRNHLCLDLNLE